MRKPGMDLDQRTELIRELSFGNRSLDPEQFGEQMRKKLYEDALRPEKKPSILRRAASRIRGMFR